VEGAPPSKFASSRQVPFGADLSVRGKVCIFAPPTEEVKSNLRNSLTVNDSQSTFWGKCRLSTTNFCKSLKHGQCQFKASPSDPQPRSSHQLLALGIAGQGIPELLPALLPQHRTALREGTLRPLPAARADLSVRGKVCKSAPPTEKAKANLRNSLTVNDSHSEICVNLGISTTNFCKSLKHGQCQFRA